MFIEFAIALVVASLVAVLIIRIDRLSGHLWADHDTQGPQKFHIHPIPRIGGAPIFVGMTAALAWMSFLQAENRVTIGLFVLAALPVFLAGIAEDLTKRVGPRVRLLAAFLSALLAAWLLDGVLYSLELPGVDWVLVSVPLAAWLVTMVAVGGVAHAFNIIDGYNGLSGMVAALVLGGLAFVAYVMGDDLVVGISLALMGAVLGFLAWNYPQGMIFAGDGGAYLMGFAVAELSVLLVTRNPQVSAWFPLLLTIYPVWETLFSVYRRRATGRPTGMPDALHLHQMIYRRLVRWMVGSRDARHLLRRNSMTAPYIWTIALLCIVPAVLFWDSTAVLQALCAMFVASYVWLYRRLVRFRTPRWLIRRRAPVLPIREAFVDRQVVRAGASVRAKAEKKRAL